MMFQTPKRDLYQQSWQDGEEFFNFFFFFFQTKPRQHEVSRARVLLQTTNYVPRCLLIFTFVRLVFGWTKTRKKLLGRVVYSAVERRNEAKLEKKKKKKEISLWPCHSTTVTNVSIALCVVSTFSFHSCDETRNVVKICQKAVERATIDRTANIYANFRTFAVATGKNGSALHPPLNNVIDTTRYIVFRTLCSVFFFCTGVYYMRNSTHKDPQSSEYRWENKMEACLSRQPWERDRACR